MNFINSKYIKVIVPMLLSAITALSGNALFSVAFLSSLFWVALFFFLFFGLIDIFLAIYYISREEEINQQVCHSDQEIKETMKMIIRTPGKVCIMSRDLSWADDPEIKACITSKANSMLIFAHSRTPLTQYLENQGVTIKYYGKWNFEPITRFTVIRYNRGNPQVAIANTENTIKKKGTIQHTIYQTQNSIKTDEWINSLAIDMIRLCESVCTVCKGETNEQTNLPQKTQ